MSVINQMLRDLDARGAASAELPAGDVQVTKKKHDAGMRVAALLLLLLMLGVAGYFALSERGPKERKQSPPTTIGQHASISAPVAVSPPVQVDQHPKPELEPAPVKRAVAPEPQPLIPKASTQPVGLLKRSISLSTPASSDAPVIAVLAQAEPAIVKKTVVSSPASEAQQLFDDAQALRRTGKANAAIGKYQQALERNPGMQNARIELAKLLQESGQADAALSLLIAGYEKQSDTGLAIAAGRMLADMGRRDEALTWLGRGRENLRPTDHALMGALLSQSQRYEESVSAYQQALVANPYQGGWLLGLGLALESLGREEEARVAYRSALEHGGFKPDVTHFLQQKLGVSDR